MPKGKGRKGEMPPRKRNKCKATKPPVTVPRIQTAPRKDAQHIKSTVALLETPQSRTATSSFLNFQLPQQPSPVLSSPAPQHL